MNRSILTTSLLGLCLSACGGDSSSGGGTGGTAGTSGSQAGAVITTTIQLLSNPDATVVSTLAQDGPRATTAGWRVEADAAGCQLKTPKQPFCGTSGTCAAGEECDVSETCVRKPSGLDVGPISVKGLQSTDITLKQGAMGNYALPPDVVLPSPAAPEGSIVTISGAGRAAVGAFDVPLPAIAPLVFTEDPTLALNQSLKLHWTAAADPSKSRIHIKLDLSHHGTFVGELDCDADDDGELEVPASLITKLIQLGTAPNPSITMTRISSGSATTTGATVKVTMESEVARNVTLP